MAQLPAFFDPLKDKINERFFCGMRFQNLIWAHYYKPDRKIPEVEIGDEAKTYCEELKNNGIVIMPGKYKSLAQHIKQTYFPYLEMNIQPDNGVFMDYINLGNRHDYTNSIYARISFKDEQIADFFLNPDLCGIIYNFYNRQPFHRIQPLVAINAVKENSKTQKEISSKFHTDLYHQITFMLLIEDLTEHDTHLQYAIGSHKGAAKPWDRYSYSDEQILNDYDIKDAIGPQGTLVIFDAGNGYHRGKMIPNSTRKYLFSVMTTGHYLVTSRDRIDSRNVFEKYKNYPKHAYNTLKEIIKT